MSFTTANVICAKHQPGVSLKSIWAEIGLFANVSNRRAYQHLFDRIIGQEPNKVRGTILFWWEKHIISPECWGQFRDFVVLFKYISRLLLFLGPTNPYLGSGHVVTFTS